MSSCPKALNEPVTVRYVLSIPESEKSEDVRVESVEKTIGRARIQTRPQFHAAFAVNQPDRDKYSRERFLVFKIRVEVERDQSIHPPANGSFSSGETKITKGEEIPFARTSS